MNSPPSPATNLTALFELIFVRSFATPDSACSPITNATDAHSTHASSCSDSAPSATICNANPANKVRLRPVRDPTHPPNRLVTTPITS